MQHGRKAATMYLTLGTYVDTSRQNIGVKK